MLQCAGQCVAVCAGQCVALCCSVLQCAVACERLSLPFVSSQLKTISGVMQRGVMSCGVL